MRRRKFKSVIVVRESEKGAEEEEYQRKRGYGMTDCYFARSSTWIKAKNNH